MSTPRPFALIRTEDQWSRVAHENTALIGEVVQLAWQETPDDSPGPAPALGAGLAFDAYCRLYHSVPDEGRIERLRWAAQDPLKPRQEQATPVDLFETVAQPDLGDFVAQDTSPTPLNQPRGLALDAAGRLFIAESGSRQILIYDMTDQRLLRRVFLDASPLDLTSDGQSVVAVLASPPGLLVLEAGTEPRPLTLPEDVSNPSRAAFSPDGELYLLDRAGAEAARIICYGQPLEEGLQVAFATDLEFATPTPDEVDDQAAIVVIARRLRENFLRFRVSPQSWVELTPLMGRNYDGLGIVRTPDNRIGFWTPQGFRHAVPARLTYLPEGRVTSFRLDSGEFHTVWGRLFLDACIPEDTAIRVHYVASDEAPEEVTLPRTPPLNVAEITIERPDLSPPMPPLPWVLPTGGPTHPLHRRETGRELPWARFAETDTFATYEAPIVAEPGRYLWVTLELHGNSRVTPRLRSLRAEYPTHDYLRRLPKTFSREEPVASFLRRYLAVFDGALGDLEARSTAREALFSSRSAPDEILPWLAGFVGLILDERWPVETRRTMIEEATWLFRFRGTVSGLARFLEIYTGVAVILLEQFRTRGLGGALLGQPEDLNSNAILGAGFRVGGAVGEPETTPLSGRVSDAFATHAHRFSVIIPANLTQEQFDVVQLILDVHRPAHTLVDVCTVGAGMRVGRGLHIELTSIIGRSGGFVPLQVGHTPLGRIATLGQARAGTSIGSGRLGADTRIG